MLRINHDLREQVRGAMDPDIARITAELQAAATRTVEREAPRLLEIQPEALRPLMRSVAGSLPPQEIPTYITTADMLEGRSFGLSMAPDWAFDYNRWTTGALKWSVMKLSREELAALRFASKSQLAPDVERALLAVRTMMRVPHLSPADKTAAVCYLLDCWFNFPEPVGIWGYRPEAVS